MNPPDRYAAPVLHRQVELLYERKRRVVLTFPVLGWLLVSLLENSGVSATAARIWLAVLCINTAGGVWLHEAYRRRARREDDDPRWVRRGIVNSALNGAVFGAVGLLLFPPEPEHQAFLLVMAAGITSTALVTSASVLGAYLAFLVLAVVPVAGRLALEPDEESRALAALTMLYAAVMTGLARTVNRTVTGAIRLELENRGLVDELSAANRELEARVAERTAELERAEAQFLQAQKLEAVGRLAGGVAHDFNNTLTVILGHCALLEDSGSLPGEARNRVGTVRAAAERAAGLTRQLLAFSRRQMLHPRPVAAGAVLDELGRMLQRLIREEVDFEVRNDSTRPILVDPGQLSHALMNLVVNAVDAIPREGRITVVAADRDATPVDVQDRPEVASGPGVEIAVADSGAGMDAATLARIFEPFFTTKELGKGTGLGLSTVWGIVAQSGGFITAQSAPGRGSTFRVWLPAAGATGEG